MSSDTVRFAETTKNSSAKEKKNTNKSLYSCYMKPDKVDAHFRTNAILLKWKIKLLLIIFSAKL